MKKILLSTFVLCAAIFSANAQLPKNDFLSGYSVGQDLEKGAYPNTTQSAETNPIKLNQWSLSGKGGNNDGHPDSSTPKTVAALTYTGYSDSGKDVAIDLIRLATGGRTDIYSLADDNAYGAGTYYIAFMSNVTAASLTSAAEFLSLDGNYTGNAQRVRYTVKGIDDATYQIGLGDSGAASTFVGPYNYGQTYLSVIKVTIDGEGTGNAWLFINPDVSGAEPATAIATTGITGTALKAIRGIVIRQRSTLAAQLGGIRLADTWAGALGQGGSSIVENDADKGNVVSTKYYNVKGIEVKAPAQNSGLYIQQNTYENGAVVSTKVIK